jgi:hypothetical protein
MSYYAVGEIQGGQWLPTLVIPLELSPVLRKARDMILSPLSKTKDTWRRLSLVYAQISMVNTVIRHYEQALANAEKSQFYCNAFLDKSAGNEYASVVSNK